MATERKTQPVGAGLSGRMFYMGPSYVGSRFFATHARVKLAKELATAKQLGHYNRSREIAFDFVKQNAQFVVSSLHRNKLLPSSHATVSTSMGGSGLHLTLFVAKEPKPGELGAHVFASSYSKHPQRGAWFLRDGADDGLGGQFSSEKSSCFVLKPGTGAGAFAGTAHLWTPTLGIIDRKETTPKTEPFTVRFFRFRDEKVASKFKWKTQAGIKETMSCLERQLARVRGRAQERITSRFSRSTFVEETHAGDLFGLTHWASTETDLGIQLELEPDQVLAVVQRRATFRESQVLLFCYFEWDKLKKEEEAYLTQTYLAIFILPDEWLLGTQENK